MKQDPKNYRKHSDRNKELINKSLTKLGAGRSVLVDSEDYLIAGNGVMEQAEALGIPTRVIETDGSELVVVKRTDLTLNDPKRKELALADNATSDTSAWDIETLGSDWGEDELADDWDVETWQPSEMSEDEMSNFFKEDDQEPEDEKFKIVLEYTEEDYNKVTEAIKKHNGSKEHIFYNLLGL